MDTKDAVKVLSKSLREDKDLFYAYQANIAMQFKDRYDERRKTKQTLSRLDVHQIANEAAHDFLNLLITESEKEQPLNC